MRKERRLAKEASHAAQQHGHKIRPFQFERMEDYIAGHSQCMHCGMEVYINTSPKQSAKEINGEAVELHCV
jgi:hypothetical protein